MTKTDEVPPRMDPSTRFVRSLDGEYFMVREAAEMLNVNHRTLRQMLNENPDELGPSFCAFFGQVKIYLYTREDVERIRDYLNERKVIYPAANSPRSVGRPAKWTDEERIARQRLYSKAHYHAKRAEALYADGDKRGSNVEKKMVTEIKKELERQKHGKQ